MTILSKQHRFSAALIDLDDTLYRNPAVPAQVVSNIVRYLVDYLNVPEHEAKDFAVDLYKQYGTTLAGLVEKGYEVDFDHWHSHVHGSLDYDNLLKPSIQLRELLCSLEIPRFVFTNADRRHAAICLDRLGVADCFQDIIHFESIQALAAVEAHKHSTTAHAVCKPTPYAYYLAMQQAGLSGTPPSQIIFIDDSVRNVSAAHGIGMFSVIVGHATPPEGCECDLAVKDLQDLQTSLPELFDNPGLGSLGVRQPSAFRLTPSHLPPPATNMEPAQDAWQNGEALHGVAGVVEP